MPPDCRTSNLITQAIPVYQDLKRLHREWRAPLRDAGLASATRAEIGLPIAFLTELAPRLTGT
jgi:hypothetical protein